VAFIDLTDVRLFYTDDGEGPFTLLLLHALSADSHDWSWVIPIWRAQYRVVAVDLRGHGNSSVPETYELNDFVTDMVALVARLGCQQVVPVGHSLGGAIAAAMAVEHSDLVSAVVEVDPAYALPDWLVRAWEAARSRWADGEDSREPLIAPSTSTPDFLTTWNDRRALAMPLDVIWKAYAGLAYGPQAMFAESLAADDYLRRRRCPVLAFHSLPGRAAWETALFQHQASRAIDWEGSGHSLQIERPSELASETMNWLGGLVADQ
jgi:pimeloyl-ACP methyl ester carboxylesterase